MTLTFVCANLVYDVDLITLPYIKLVDSTAACGSGIGDALPGSMGQLIYSDSTHGVLSLTLGASVAPMQAKACYSTNGYAGGLYSRVGSTVLTVASNGVGGAEAARHTVARPCGNGAASAGSSRVARRCRRSNLWT